MMWESSGSGRHGEGPSAPPSAGVGPPHLRPFLWAYPNFDPAQAPLRASVSPGALDDCASWRGARGEDHPPTGSNPFQAPSLPGALPVSSGGGSPNHVVTSLSSQEHFARGVLNQGQEQRHDRELQEKTRQLQQQQHWLLDDPSAVPKETHLSWGGDGSASSQATAASPPAPTSAAAQLRSWKRTCLQGEAGAGFKGASSLGGRKILGHPVEAPTDGRRVEEELALRRVRRTVGGKKLVEEALPGRALDQVQGSIPGDLGRPEPRAYRVGPWGHGTASAAGSGLGSVSSIPAGESAAEESLQRAHTEPPEGTKRARRAVLRRKRKEAEGLAGFESPTQQGVEAGLGVASANWARECLDCAAAAAATAGEPVGVASSQRGGSACPKVIEAGDEESESCAAPQKRSKAAALTPETSCAGVVFLSSSELRLTAEGRSELGEWPKIAEQQPKGTRADGAGKPSAPAAEGSKRRLLSAPESSGPSSLTNASSLSQSNSCLGSSKAGDTGAGRTVCWQGGTSKGVAAGLGGKGSASLPLLSQALSSSSSQCTTSSGVMGGTSPSPPSLGGSSGAGFVAFKGPHSSSMSALAPLHESRCREVEHVVEEAEMLDRPGIREINGKEKKGVEFRISSPHSNDNSSGSDDEAGPKFVLSSGRALSAPGRPKKQVTIDDEFESYFAKLLL